VRWPHKWGFKSGPAALSGHISKAPGFAGGYLLEDETLIRLMLAEMIEELGHQIVAEAGSIESALPLAETAAFDIAILDVNIGGYYIDKVAQTIVRRGLPFIFVTGYAKAALPPAFIDRPHLQKPCLREMLRREITSALGPEAA
jgi:CheY-like chemotaxis protein